MKWLETLTPDRVKKLKAYESARSLAVEGKIFLDANESPFPGIPGTTLNRYPSPQPPELVERFSSLYKVKPEQLIITRGSDEVIDLLVRTFCQEGRDKILICPPTYGMYEVSASIQGIEIVKVPLLKTSGNLDLNLNSLKYSVHGCKIIFLCSPNNPTGTVFSKDDLEQICSFAKDKSLVVVDEAYAEFSGESMLSGLLKNTNLVVLRTLSKAWGLAGVRLGCAIAHPEVIKLLQKVRAPYPLSTPSIETGLEGTNKERATEMEQRVNFILKERMRLEENLRKLKQVEKIYPSGTNFILAKFSNADEVFDYLKKAGMIIRHRGKDDGLEGCLRFTIGTIEENDEVLNLLKGVCGE